MKRRLYIKGCINEIEYVHVLLQSFTNRDQKANFIKRKMNMSAFENRKIQFFILVIAIGVFIAYTTLVKQGYQLHILPVKAGK